MVSHRELVRCMVLGRIGRINGHYSPWTVEEEIKRFWEENKIYDKVKKKSMSQPRKFLFIDGPPYPSGDIPHIGTAWNKTIKDVILRYKRMRGYNVYDRPGYDCHGLPIEVKVEQKLGIKVKREIEEKIGVDKFIQECKNLALSNLSSMTKWFRELGVFMDWENPYLTLRDEYIEAGWWLFKKVYEKGLLDSELRVVYWCPRCSTTLAEYEIEYKVLEDPSIYVKFPVRGREKEYILIWTTTPWTLPANTFVMAHPDETYVRIRVGDEKYILAKTRLEHVVRETGIKEYEVIEEFRGKELEGLEYDHPLRGIVPLQEKLSKHHKVFMAPEVVTMYEGTGLVHGAPGHGMEDFSIAKKYGVDIIASPVDDEGRFTEEAGKYKGLYVRDANPVIIQDLRDRGALLWSGSVQHKYPICWRCKTPVLQRATRQWIIRVTKLKEELKREASRVNWMPGWALERLMNMLENLQDWVISRQRYWGTPLPIWICPDGHRLVIGSIKELEEHGGRRPVELHRPWIDEVVLKCPVCGKPMKRVPDVADVWFDSGIAFYAARAHPERLPRDEVVLDFITEGHDQIRGWFFSLLRSGVLGFGKAPYKNVLVHGFVLDEHGREMHKSLGNYVGTDEAIEKMGRDPLRLWVLQATAWEDLRFSWKGIEETRKDLSIAWNTYVFASTYMELDGYDPVGQGLERFREHLRIEDKWILSRINTLTKRVTEYLEKYHVHEAARLIRKFIVEDVSHWYIRLIRPRVWIEENVPDKLAAYATLYYVLKKWLLLASPMIPFMAEKIYQKFLRPAEPGAPESIHLMEWPSIDEEYIDLELEDEMELIKQIYEASAAARMKAGIKLRQPVKSIIIYSDDERIAGTIKKYADLVKRIANAKNVEVRPVSELGKLVRYKIEPIYKEIGPRFRKQARQVIKYLLEHQDEVARTILAEGKALIKLEDGGEAEITKDYVKITPVYIEGYSVEDTEWGAVVIDTRLTEEELAEGLARDVIRRIQVMRKELNLPLDARIIVWMTVPEQHVRMIEKKLNYIAGETRAEKIMITSEHPGDAYTKEWEIEGETYKISIKQI